MDSCVMLQRVNGGVGGGEDFDIEALKKRAWRVVFRSQFFLNGVKTADFSLEDTDFINRVAGSKFGKWTHFARYRKGHIGFQDHGDKVSFRNIKILKMD